jgi:hypothetical protein
MWMGERQSPSTKYRIRVCVPKRQVLPPCSDAVLRSALTRIWDRRSPVSFSWSRLGREILPVRADRRAPVDRRRLGRSLALPSCSPHYFLLSRRPRLGRSLALPAARQEPRPPKIASPSVLSSALRPLSSVLRPLSSVLRPLRRVEPLTSPERRCKLGAALPCRACGDGSLGGCVVPTWHSEVT